MKWLIWIIAFYIICDINPQVTRRWSPEELIRKSLDSNPQKSYFISDPNQYFESSDIKELTEDLKQIYIHFHFTVFLFVFPQMTPEYNLQEGNEGINKFANNTLIHFLQQTDFGEENIIFIVYPIENEVIKIIGGSNVLNIYTDNDLLDILQRQLNNFRDEKLIESFHNIFDEIAYDTPHSIIMKLKYFIWRFQSLAIGLVAGILFILKFAFRKTQNEVFINKMQMFVLQLKFQAKWKTHCMICLEKLPKTVKKKKSNNDDGGCDDGGDEEEDTENNSKKKLKRYETDEEDEDIDKDSEEEEKEKEFEEVDEEEESEEEEISKQKKPNTKGKNKYKEEEEEEEDDKYIDNEDEDDDNDKCEYVDKRRLILDNFSNKKKGKNKAKDKDASKAKEKKVKEDKQSKFVDINPEISIKIRKALRQNKRKKTEKKSKREEIEKPKPKSKTKQTSKESSGKHTRNNSHLQTNQLESLLFNKKNPKESDKMDKNIKAKKEDDKPVNIFKAKYTLSEANKSGKEKITLDCGHSFHRRCFDQWHDLKQTSKCPVCAYNVFSNSNLIGDDSFKSKLVQLQQVFHPELKNIDVNL